MMMVRSRCKKIMKSTLKVMRMRMTVKVKVKMKVKMRMKVIRKMIIWILMRRMI